jgi:hypothetical protein
MYEDNKNYSGMLQVYIPSTTTYPQYYTLDTMPSSYVTNVTDPTAMPTHPFVHSIQQGTTNLPSIHMKLACSCTQTTDSSQVTFRMETGDITGPPLISIGHDASQTNQA